MRKMNYLIIMLKIIHNQRIQIIMTKEEIRIKCIQ